jgi:hypothetical protein
VFLENLSGKILIHGSVKLRITVKKKGVPECIKA